MTNEQAGAELGKRLREGEGEADADADAVTNEQPGAALGKRLREGDLSAAPATLNLLESVARQDREQGEALLAEVSGARTSRDAHGHIIGITGPPGSGKSTLLSALLAAWRRDRRSVAMLAVDPSSRRSGGSLLGDRARIEFDPSDDAVFIRSTAAGERFGGLAWGTRAAARALAAAFDLVVIETVGVGQAETEIANVADTVLVVVQPSGGDSLQFIKSGIMEIPDIAVVTKADLGVEATRAMHDLRASLRSLHDRSTKALAVSALPPPTGIEELVQALDAHYSSIDVEARRRSGRIESALSEFAIEHGEHGVRSLGGRTAARRLLESLDPQLSEPELEAALVSELQRRAHAAEARPVSS